MKTKMKFLCAALMVMGTSLMVLGEAAAQQTTPSGTGSSPSASVPPPLEIIQSGNNNEILIEQESSPDERVAIIQTGNDQHIGTASGASPVYGITLKNVNGANDQITQSGVGNNSAELHQDTVTGGKAIIEQVPTALGSAKNSAIINQTRTTGVEAVIRQSGTTGNTATITQTDSGQLVIPAGTSITQKYQVDYQCTVYPDPLSCTEISIGTVGLPVNSVLGQATPGDAIANIQQAGGGGHVVTIDQTNSTSASAIVRQDGSNQTAHITQTSVTADTESALSVTTLNFNSPFGGSYDTTYFRPISYSDYRNITTDTLHTLLPALVNVFQDGDHHSATINQVGGQQGAMKATVDQTGSTQTARIDQLSSSYVQASVYQRGMGNSGTVFQDNVVGDNYLGRLTTTMLAG